MILAYRLADHMRIDANVEPRRVYSSVYAAWQRLSEETKRETLASTADVMKYGGEVVVV